MASEAQISQVLSSLAEIVDCPHCGVRIRFGDVDCPRCGADLEEALRGWAARLVDGLSLAGR